MSPEIAIKKELFPFENHFLKTDAGAEVHYVDEGQGVVVLMLHGNPAWSFLYRKMIMRFFMKEGFVNRPSDRALAMYEAPFRDKRNRIQTAIFPRQLVKAHAFEAKVESGLGKLAEKPVLFLWGNEDFAFQQPELERFKSHFPNHVHHPLEASHFWQDEQGEVASDYIIDWARQQNWL
ncbi:MAG: hypothetical protein IH820_10465 [Bacteroidetes bacterium]|nr:hypothetical protein [Bacteroidota bacterium]